MDRIPIDPERRKRNLELVLPDLKDALTPGSEILSLKLRPSEKARIVELVAVLTRLAQGRRNYTMSSVVRYAINCLYVDICDVSPDMNQREKSNGSASCG